MEQQRSGSKELILDNAFNKIRLPHFFDAQGPSMVRAMTLDERRLLSSHHATSIDKTQKFDFENLSCPLKRSATFVTKFNLEVKDDSTLQDVLYRKYFSSSHNDGNTRPIVPGYSSALKFPQQPTPIYYTKEKAVVIVDPFSSGSLLSHEIYLQGYRIICLLSNEKTMDQLHDGLKSIFRATLTFKHLEDDQLAFDQLVSDISSFAWPVVAVMAGAETGVELADRLSSHLGLRTNGVQLSEARRNKYVMGETIRRAGIRAVKQLKATTWGQVEQFLDEWKPDPFQVVLKPVESAGSEDVILCRNLTEVQVAFGRIIGKVNGLGLLNKEVLVQEYLEGQEYVVDMVSRDGVHKVVAIWKPDRRDTNHSSFLCHGLHLVPPEEVSEMPQLIAYQKQVLTTLGILNGPSHGKVKLCQGEPTILKVGASCHGGEGTWVNVANHVIGYNQLSAAISSYKSKEEFDLIPNEPSSLHRKFGSLKYLVSMKSGQLQKISEHGICETPSYLDHKIFVQLNETIKKTVDSFSWAGYVQLCHDNLETLLSDSQRIDDITLHSLLEIVEDESEHSKLGVVVVDPFSTGASLAAHLYKHKYKVIAVYSANMEQLSTMKNLIPQGIDLVFESIVAFDDGIDGVSEKLMKLDFSIVAVMAGAETGVELADRLSSHLGLRTNGVQLSEARRNKYVMGETIRRAGIRAVKQLKATTWGQVEQFLDEWKPDPFQVVLKPVESAGSEDVILCRNLTEVQVAFGRIIGKVNGLGLLNKEVLVQEYLEGQEYVVDMVSRDGVHKVVAIWECDKRAVNGADFVLHGYIPTIVSAEAHEQLVTYQKRVLTALGILNGPSHGELKWCRGEPVLVEVGARCHGGEGTWVDVANNVYGCNQVTTTAAVYLDHQEFDLLPPQPTHYIDQGRLLCIVCKVKGFLLEINADFIEEIRHMRSFIRMEIFLKPGDIVKKTIDCFTLGGVIMLSHRYGGQVEADYARIREMEDQNLFICEEA